MYLYFYRYAAGSIESVDIALAAWNSWEFDGDWKMATWWFGFWDKISWLQFLQQDYDVLFRRRSSLYMSNTARTSLIRISCLYSREEHSLRWVIFTVLPLLLNADKQCMLGCGRKISAVLYIHIGLCDVAFWHNSYDYLQLECVGTVGWVAQW